MPLSSSDRGPVSGPGQVRPAHASQPCRVLGKGRLLPAALRAPRLAVPACQEEREGLSATSEGGIWFVQRSFPGTAPLSWLPRLWLESGPACLTVPEAGGPGPGTEKLPSGGLPTCSHSSRSTVCLRSFPRCACVKGLGDRDRRHLPRLPRPTRALLPT